VILDLVLPVHRVFCDIHVFSFLSYRTSTEPPDGPYAIMSTAVYSGVSTNKVIVR